MWYAFIHLRAVLYALRRSQKLLYDLAKCPSLGTPAM